MIKQRRVSVADAQRGFESLCRYQQYLLAELDLSPKVVSFCCDEQHLRPFVLAPPEMHPFGQSLYTTA